MPHRPDLPCAVCGKLLWRQSKTSLPPGLATCQECRRARRLAALAEVRVWKTIDCETCSVQFVARITRRFCSRTCQPGVKRRNAAWGSEKDPRSRAAVYGVEYRPIRRSTVFERDAWTCGICSGPVDQSLTFPHPMSPSIDHIMPMSLGGGHVLSNVQCAHLSCNIAKGVTVETGHLLSA